MTDGHWPIEADPEDSSSKKNKWLISRKRIVLINECDRPSAIGQST